MAKRRNYTEEEKRLAVATYVVHGTLTGAAKQCGIPYTTIQRWKKDNPAWWEKIAAEVWEQEGEKIRSRYGQIVDLGSAIEEIVLHLNERQADKVTRATVSPHPYRKIRSAT